MGQDRAAASFPASIGIPRTLEVLGLASWEAAAEVEVEQWRWAPVLGWVEDL